MTEYCDLVDCPNEAMVIIPDGKNVCSDHAIMYQRDLATRMARDGVSLL